MVQAASVLAVMTTPAVSAPALVVMEPVAHVTRTSANVTKIAAAQESSEMLKLKHLHSIYIAVSSHCAVVSETI